METKTQAIELGQKSESNNIAVDMNAPIETFGDGAIRSSKRGKGRYDLIPGTVMKHIIAELKNGIHVSSNDEEGIRILYNFIYSGNLTPAIAILTSMGYSNDEFEPLIFAFNRMQKDLAIHYENGAEIYGENNWKHGIPKWSFISSGIRHTQQYINGETDEPHLISAIWNFCNAIWCDHRDKLGI